jgi:hypothetical protein
MTFCVLESGDIRAARRRRSPLPGAGDRPGAYPDLYNLDIYREVGANAADVKSFDVTVADSTLTLGSIAYVDVPELEAIEIVPKS